MLAPFFGVVTAGCTNLLCMRNDELRNGVIIRDPAGNDVGMVRPLRCQPNLPAYVAYISAVYSMMPSL
jgi:hypothetical protein